MVVRADHQGPRIRMVAHEQADNSELLLGPRRRYRELDEGQPRQRAQTLRREQLDMRIADHGRVEGRIPPAARIRRPGSLRAHARLLQEA
jgi:hypothetical protein